MVSVMLQSCFMENGSAAGFDSEPTFCRKIYHSMWRVEVTYLMRGVPDGVGKDTPKGGQGVGFRKSKCRDLLPVKSQGLTPM